MGVRYEYIPRKSLDTGQPIYIVEDKEATGMWNAWEFDTEEEALAFITDKVVGPLERKTKDR